LFGFFVWSRDSAPGFFIAVLGKQAPLFAKLFAKEKATYNF
jgi:hypothetical protein